MINLNLFSKFGIKIYSKLKTPFLLLALISSILISCETEEEEIAGCTDSLSYNYNPEAYTDDGSCAYYYGGREMGQIDVGATIDLNNEYNIYIDNEFIGRLTQYFPNGLECGNPNAVGRIFTSGSHVIRAEGNGGSDIREGIVTLSPQECKVVILENLPLAGGGGTGTGDAIFWTDSDFGCGPITVNLAGVGSTTINGFFGSSPSCSSTGVGGNFNNLAPGNYNFTASCSNFNWSGSISITEDGCARQQLLDGGGGGGGNTTGDVIFWINQDFGCGPITVNLNGIGSSTITSYFGSAPNCSNTSGGGNFNNLPSGNYSFTATCSNLSWSGNLTVSQNSCLRFQLN